MRAVCFAILAAALAACAPNAADVAPGTASGACAVSAAHIWSPVEAPYTIRAEAQGPTCPNSIATLTIENAAGDRLWTGGYPTAQVMVLADANQNEDSLREALANWIDPQAINIHTTADLPEWAPNAELPGGEFPFMPEAWAGRDTYAAYRARGLPMFCYVQGMESIACLVLEDGRLAKIGVQLFPG